MHSRPESGRVVPELARRAAGCREIREDLSRFAADTAPRRPLVELARHARHCRHCSDWMDALAVAREWLARAPFAAGPRDAAAGDLSALAARMRHCLARELSSRLARDLLSVHDGRRPRAWPLVRRDFRRLVALLGPQALRGAEEREAAVLLSRAARAVRPDITWRGRAGHLAARFDRCGLDVVLAHVALLEREGRRDDAEREVVRVLGLFA